jgi:hypothetical protein
MENNQENSPISLQSTSKDNQFSDRLALKLLYAFMLADNRNRYPNNPYPLRPKHYNLRNTADFTRAITKFIQLHGFQANMINPKVRFVNNSFYTTDILGHRLKIGSNSWIGGALSNGAPIVTATILGRSVKLEIRNTATQFRQSEAQKQYQHQIEQAGGIYFIVNSFGEFANWFYEMIGGDHDR